MNGPNAQHRGKKAIAMLATLRCHSLLVGLIHEVTIQGNTQQGQESLCDSPALVQDEQDYSTTLLHKITPCDHNALLA